MSFSASAKVEGDTSGPTAGAVPNAGGVPGGSSAGFWALLGPAAAAPSKLRDVRARNCLRDFDMYPPIPHCSRALIRTARNAGADKPWFRSYGARRGSPCRRPPFLEQLAPALDLAVRRLVVRHRSVRADGPFPPKADRENVL